VEVKIIGIIGARTPGKELAAAALAAGYSVILEDVSPEMLAQGIELIESTLAPAERDAHLQSFKTSRSVEDVTRVADMLIEALPEELEAKLEIFTVFDKFAKPGAILASTSRETAIFDLADMTYRAEKCVGFRFAAGAPQSIEIIRARGTSQPTIATCEKVALKMNLAATIIEEPKA
jgi:3-hydroxybutyryl-CoA dehydrogenase